MAVSNVGVFIQEQTQPRRGMSNGQPSSNPVITLKLSAAKIPAITYDIAQKGWYLISLKYRKAGI